MYQVKQSTTVDEQIALLEKRGMLISDPEQAGNQLLDLGYFRLGFYCFPFEVNYPNKEKRDHIYKQDVKFEDIIDLYFFDSKLREIFSRYLSRIEINFRTKLIYIASNHYKSSPTWFADENIVSLDYALSFKKKIYNQTFKQNPTIKEHHVKYENAQYAPAWKTLEFMTFGNILTLYSNLREKDIQKNIAQQYNFRCEKIFFNYMDTLRRIRNYCAHNSLLYDLNLPQSIKNGPAGKLKGNQHNLEGVIMILKYIVGIISSDLQIEFTKEIDNLYMNAPISINHIVSKCRNKTNE